LRWQPFCRFRNVHRLLSTVSHFGSRTTARGHSNDPPTKSPNPTEPVQSSKAPTEFVDAAGVRFAYRRFGKAGGVPLVFNMHYLGTMDYWDSTVTDGLACDREVILFDNAGVSSSSGEVPTTLAGRQCGRLQSSTWVNKADMLGFSISGMVAQEITLQAPDLVRKLFVQHAKPSFRNKGAPIRRCIYKGRHHERRSQENYR
jgi:pimeloyl-ACP methyl ester carboxylesterase